MKKTLITNRIQETSEQLMLQRSQTTTYSSQDFLVRAFRLLEKETDFGILAELSFLKSHVFLKKDTLAFYSLRTSKGFSLTKWEALSTRLSKRLMNWGMTFNGRCLTANILE